MVKKIVIDARLYGSDHTGIGVYTRGLIKHFPVVRDLQIILIISPDQKANQELNNFQVYIAKFHPYSLWSQLEMLYLLIRIRPQLLHVPHFAIPVFWPGRIITTIHDLIKHISRGPSSSTRHPLLYWIKYLFYLMIVKTAMLRSYKIIVPSRYWKELLVSSGKIPNPQIYVIYEGIDETYFKPEPLFPKPALNKPYILYVGNIYPHKNVQTIIRAVIRMKGRIHLYICCARDIFWERLQKDINLLGGQGLVTNLGKVSDHHLKYLYQNSLSFVTASNIEGFGLPGLEAMACQTAVISSNASCLPEIYSNAALYFHPDSQDQLIEKISLLLKNKHLRKDLINKGITRARSFSWQKMSQETLNVYLQSL